jgi:Zn-dependent protease/CBS domain-containing protein
MLTIAHIGQTTLQIHWSWPPALLLLAGLLSSLYTQSLSSTIAVLAGLATALLIYGSILLHELAHGVAGHVAGFPVRTITLFAFGGRTEVEETRSTAVKELLIAISGPTASSVLTAIWWIAGATTSPGPTQTFTFALAGINGGLLALNLLPGYPLDGGRILKAALWFLLDDEIPAARSATLIGRACGWVLVLIGVVIALGTNNLAYGMVFGGAGYFLSRTAMDGFRRLALQRALQGIRVADIMQHVFRAVDPDLPLDQFVSGFVLGQSENGFPVIPRPDVGPPQLLLGMMSVRNLRRFTISQWTLTRIHEAMTPIGRIRALSPETSAADALKALVESDQDLLPVVLGQDLLGVVRRRDLLFYVHMRMAKM